MPTGALDTAVDSLIEDVSSKVFGKRVIEKEDSVTVDGRVEIFCDTLIRRLSPAVHEPSGAH
jgi:hypothetical protein